jgi:hypothetical protein
MPNFPKTEKIEFRLRQDLADRLPEKNGERNRFLNSAVEHELDPPWVKAGRAKTPKKAAAAQENGKKGGRPKKRWFAIIVRDGEGNTQNIVQEIEYNGPDHKMIHERYPDAINFTVRVTKGGAEQALEDMLSEPSTVMLL